MRLHPTVAAVLLAVGACCHLGDTWAQTPPPAAEAPTLRPEIAPPLQAAQKAINDKDFATALQQLQAAEQVAGRTPFETYVLERLRFLAAAGQRDTPGALKALEAALATGQVEAELKATLMDQASNAAYALKDYDKTVHWARQALAAGATADITRLRLAQALYLQGQHAPAAQVLAELATQQRAAGQVPTEPQLRLQASNLLKMGDEAGYARVLEDLIALAPKPELWADRLARLLRQPGFDEALTLDLFRLSRHVGAFATTEADLQHGDLALRAGFPAEAKAVLDAGFAAGRLGQGPQAAQHQALRDKATKAAVADAAGSTSDGPALLARDPALALAAGWAQFTAGQRDAGLALMRQAVQKAPQPRLQLRLAEALRTAGDTAAARTALTAARDAAATDGTSDLARLALLSLGRP
ncbi:hypothetical protein [Rubrivivax albus]|uniref:Tetratricopeptide repeat protein n=1 Tax=Rubrivivax albus TaxID=2499835 RepID=A0A3S2TJ75_9BURK|nr:hypothetical protein [Rubrivivax albus]RVT48517.1 hypothetical protein ENE75_22820 [Rubrivivax albus]